MAIAVSVVGAAAAQSPANQRFKPEWQLKPTGRDFEKLFPRDALEQHISGVAILCCTPKSDRTLSCQLGADWPKDAGFGRAGLKMSERFALTAQSYEEFQQTQRTPLWVPITFIADPASPQVLDALKKVKEITAQICSSQPNS